MKRIVITEGESDILLLKALLGKESDGVEFVKAGGWSAADSLARSYLIDGQHDVALVVDADSYEPRGAEERKEFLTQSLASVALRTRWEVFVIAPEIEALLFLDRTILEKLIGRTVGEIEFQEGRFAPKKTLMKLLSGESRTRFFKKALSNIDLAPLQNQTQLKHLRRFLNPALKKAA